MSFSNETNSSFLSNAKKSFEIAFTNDVFIKNIERFQFTSSTQHTKIEKKLEKSKNVLSKKLFAKVTKTKSIKLSTIRINVEN